MRIVRSQVPTAPARILTRNHNDKPYQKTICSTYEPSTLNPHELTLNTQSRLCQKSPNSTDPSLSEPKSDITTIKFSVPRRIEVEVPKKAMGDSLGSILSPADLNKTQTTTTNNNKQQLLYHTAKKLEVRYLDSKLLSDFQVLRD
jgi:hypothetical protein